MMRGIRRLSLSYILCLAAIAAFYLMFRTERLVVFPGASDSVSPRLYSDVREGGSSSVEFFDGDSAVALRMVLHSGVYHPYAGVEFPLQETFEALTLKGVDFSAFDSVTIVFRASADVALVLYSADPNVSKLADPLSLRPLRLDVPATRHYTEHRLALAEIETPRLWFDMHGIEKDPNRYLDHVVQVAVESGKGSLLGLPGEIEIRKIEFFGKNETAIGASLAILILATGIFIGGIVKTYGRKEN